MTYGRYIYVSDINGLKSTWTVSGCDTQEDADRQAFEWAIRDGWTPPKWWQWWRWNDTRLPEGFTPGATR